MMNELMNLGLNATANEAIVERMLFCCSEFRGPSGDTFSQGKELIIIRIFLQQLALILFWRLSFIKFYHLVFTTFYATKKLKIAHKEND